MTWASWLSAQLGRLLDDEGLGDHLVATPDADVFAAGFDSMRTFALLDELAGRGVEVDFSDFVTNATTGWLLAEIERSGVPAP